MTSLPADSAGVPWQGRSFDAHPRTSVVDDGSAPPLLLSALENFAIGSSSVIDVVDALRVSRLLVPVMAELTEAGVGIDGRYADKSAELGIVSVAGPDGRHVLPVFSSVDSMKAWNADARPVPSDAVRVALAAASESTELVVLDAGSRTEFVMRRPALWAIAQGKTWVPSFLDEEVLNAFLVAAADEPSIAAISLDSGDPQSNLSGPELAVTVAIHPGLDRVGLDLVIERLSGRIAADTLIAERVDSMGLTVTPASAVGVGG